MTLLQIMLKSLTEIIELNGKRLMNFKNSRILKLAAVITVMIIAAYCFLSINKCTQRSIFAMDTYMEITAYGWNSKKAADKAIDEICRLEDMLSTEKTDSEIARINQTKSVNISDETAYLISKSNEISKSTQGAFDITIYPVMRAWGFGSGEYRVPDSVEIKELIKRVDYTRIEYDEAAHKLSIPDEVEIDFGGIAKGYTSDKVAEVMQQYGIKSAILNLGGNVKAVGSKLDGSKWKVAVKSPCDSAQYMGILSINDTCVITSGGYERFFEKNGKKYHHIIDPDTGLPADSGLISVTVVCNDGTKADALSTALFIMGNEKAQEYWRKHKTEFDMILMDSNEHIYVTEGIEDDFESQYYSVEIIK